MPQTWGVIGTAAAAYRVTSVSHRVKALTALGALGITVPITVWFGSIPCCRKP